MPSESAPHVLVVDDEPTIQRLLARMLREAGLRVTAMGSAEEALAWLTARNGGTLAVVDATISDVRLPRMNGCLLGREIVRRWPQTRMLFISGYIEEELRARRLCPGNLPLLPKPFTMTELLARVRQTLVDPPWVPDSWPEGDPEEELDA